MGMSKKDFIAFGEMIDWLRDDSIGEIELSDTVNLSRLVEAMCEIFIEANPNFNKQKFMSYIERSNR